jgi:uroporphyrinogen-III synthase
LKKAGQPRALLGRRILVGRARHQASALSSDLRDLGADVIEIPFIEIRKPRSYKPLDAALANLQHYDWLILTSVNGVEAVWDRLKKLRLTMSGLPNLKIAAIGPATEKAIVDRGLRVDVVPAHYIAESVVKSLQTQVEGKRILLARAKVARDVIPHELRKLGANVDVVEAYETVVPRTSAMRLHSVLNDSKRRPDIITFTSSSTVRNFLELLGKQWPKGNLCPDRKVGSIPGILFASIGPVTSTTLQEKGLPVDIEAKEFTIPGLIQAIVSHASTKVPIEH